MICRRHSSPVTYVGENRILRFYRCVKGGHLIRVRRPTDAEPLIQVA
jgi:hypothetical protein